MSKAGLAIESHVRRSRLHPTKRVNIDILLFCAHHPVKAQAHEHLYGSFKHIFSHTNTAGYEAGLRRRNTTMSTYSYPSQSQSLSSLSSSVASLRSSLSLLDSSISILDAGISDFPRLKTVLSSTRVRISFITPIIFLPPSHQTIPHLSFNRQP